MPKPVKLFACRETGRHELEEDSVPQAAGRAKTGLRAWDHEAQGREDLPVLADPAAVLLDLEHGVALAAPARRDSVAEAWVGARPPVRRRPAQFNNAFAKLNADLTRCSEHWIKFFENRADAATRLRRRCLRSHAFPWAEWVSIGPNA